MTFFVKKSILSISNASQSLRRLMIRKRKIIICNAVPVLPSYAAEYPVVLCQLMDELWVHDHGKFIIPILAVWRWTELLVGQRNPLVWIGVRPTLLRFIKSNLREFASGKALQEHLWRKKCMKGDFLQLRIFNLTLFRQLTWGAAGFFHFNCHRSEGERICKASVLELLIWNVFRV